MANLACRICGRLVYTTAPIEALDPEELRCPRCGAHLATERRIASRRTGQRRVRPMDDAGPPGGQERRVAERRQQARRRDDGGPAGA